MRHVRKPFTPLILLLAFVVPGCSQEPEGDATAAAAPATAPPPACELTMGWDPWEPYQYRDVRGEVTGLDVEIAKAVAAAAGCELVFVDGQWMDMLNRLRDGDVDLLAGATATSGREAFAAFTAPYRSESFVVFTLADNAGIRDAKSLEEVFGSGARIGTVSEYYYGEEASALLDAIAAEGRLGEAAVSELNYQRLLHGEIDAFLEDPFVASSILRSRGWGRRIVATNIGTATGDVAFMISRQSVAPETVRRFSDGLQKIRDDGTLAAIIEEYRH